jgi:hypothetical protein
MSNDCMVMNSMNTGSMGLNVCPHLSVLHCPMQVEALWQAHSPPKQPYQISKMTRFSS